MLLSVMYSTGIIVNVLPMYVVGTPTGKCPFNPANHQRFHQEIDFIGNLLQGHGS